MDFLVFVLLQVLECPHILEGTPKPCMVAATSSPVCKSLVESQQISTKGRASKIPTIVERAYSLLFFYISMGRQKAVAESIIPPPVKEPVNLMDPQVLLDQSIDEPLTIPSIMAKQFHQLLLQV